MAVTIYQGHSCHLARADVNVVIDVIRAFTFAHYAFIKGAKEILLADTIHSAFQVKERQPEYLLAGEKNGLYIAGFDLDNSPKSLIETELEGKTLVQKTTNGVKAALNALDAKHLFVTGFSNARTTAEYIEETFGADKKIQIIASHPTGDDDLACAEYMKDIIDNRDCRRAAEASSRIKGSESAQKFFDDNRPEFNSGDIEMCLKELNSHFVMKVNQKNNLPRIVRVDS
ncbi:2-phosphosulfolactate phosphatase [Domibacillus epiphyticus]|uniref:Probable 2-phosphosulfolactate phosphatase n=1 Tax=Domibacillus epiphyticus TaxID=1714355 RepID=A0A1V2A8M2_9BACI|nr:2-phosphosulfolactate phosphatase [Domibacillus epiphyticus]OMP67349.1 2-phosphosulfolactate phosphatase [Domibacillus epiphyticus]